jgi:hypothetical protein
MKKGYGFVHFTENEEAEVRCTSTWVNFHIDFKYIIYTDRRERNGGV